MLCSVAFRWDLHWLRRTRHAVLKEKVRPLSILTPQFRDCPGQFGHIV